MSLSAFIEALIGLVFIYFVASVFASSINEFLAQELGRRGKFLREGLLNVVGDRWVYLRLINQPLISSLYRDVPGKPKTPSYIPAPNFVDALLDTMLSKARQIDPDFAPETEGLTTFKDVRTAVALCKSAGFTTGDAILPLLDAARGDLQLARQNIAAWYESGMERVSGWYKKYTRRVLLLIGLAIAVLCNVDTLQIVTQLASSSSLRKAMADMGTDAVNAEKVGDVPLVVSPGEVKIAPEHRQELARTLAELEKKGLPVGFSCMSPQRVEAESAPFGAVIRECWNQTKSQAGGSWFLKIIGWLLTALAISFGAPFWFDLLGRLVDLRGSGKKPDTVKTAPAL
jgi:hypothetical protein